MNDVTIQLGHSCEGMGHIKTKRVVSVSRSTKTISADDSSVVELPIDPRYHPRGNRLPGVGRGGAC
jgi:hypothetical protein